jgi:hypothetical protein
VKEQPKIEQLVEILTAQEKEPRSIIKVLCSIIKQQMMFGGALEDKINFVIEEAKKRSL